jgi:hypothetical protein
MFGAGVIGLAMMAALMVWTVPESLIMDPETHPLNISPTVEFSVFSILPMTTLLITAAMGGAFGKSDPWGPEIAMSSFHAARPLTTARLVFAKWFAAARMVLLAWGMFIFATAVISLAHPHLRRWFLHEFWPYFIGTHPVLVQWITNPVVLLTLLLLQWHLVVTSMSVVLSGSKRRVAVSGWVGIIALSAFIGVITWFVQRRNHFELARPILPWVAVAFVAFKLWGAFTVFRVARRELLTPKESAVLVLLWSTLVAGTAFSAAAALHADALPKELIWFLAIWFLPSGEMPACVIHLAMNRHR